MHAVQNKQTSQSSQTSNGACQSAGINTDENQLIETLPHCRTAYTTICLAMRMDLN